MGLKTRVVGGLIAALTATASFADDCACNSYPFEPQACFDGCTAQMLNTVPLGDLFDTLDLSEDAQSDILAAQTSPSPPTSLAAYSDAVQSAVRAAMSSADPARIQALVAEE